MAGRRILTPEARREQILQAAGQLFVEHGFERTTTKEIARTAGIAEGTIYKYFASKQDILFALVKGRILGPLESIFDTTQGTDDAQIIRTFIRTRFENFSQNGNLIQMLFSEGPQHPQLLQEYYQSVARPALQLLEQYIASRTEAGAFRPVNTMVVTRTFIGALIFNYLIFERLLGDRVEQVPHEVLIDELTALFLNALRKDPTTATTVG